MAELVENPPDLLRMFANAYGRLGLSPRSSTPNKSRGAGLVDFSFDIVLGMDGVYLCPMMCRCARRSPRRAHIIHQQL